MKHRLLWWASVWAIAWLGCGCQHVSPWERGALADPAMNTARDPVGDSMADHIWFSREAASGGRGVGGGGCGCN